MAQTKPSYDKRDIKLQREPTHKRDRYEARKFKQALREIGMKGGF
jgi:hypothetical protein